MAGKLAEIALAPLLLAQGLWVASRALRLPAPDGPRSGAVGTGPALRLLILGDSSAAGVGAPHQDQALSGHLTQALSAHFTVEWQVVARSGWRTAQALTVIRALPPRRYDAAVLALGVNDVTKGVPMRRWLDQQAELAAHLLRSRGVRRIYASGVPPMGGFPLLPHPLRRHVGQRAEAFDHALAQACARDAARRHLPFDPALLSPEMMAEDGFHPSPRLYRLWAARLAEAITEDFAFQSQGLTP